MIGAKSVRGQGHNLPNLNGDNRQLVLFERGWVPDIIAMLFYPYMKGHGSIIWVCTTKKSPSSYWWDANFLSMEFLSPCFNASTLCSGTRHWTRRVKRSSNWRRSRVELLSATAGTFPPFRMGKDANLGYHLPRPAVSCSSGRWSYFGCLLALILPWRSNRLEQTTSLVPFLAETWNSQISSCISTPCQRSEILDANFFGHDANFILPSSVQNFNQITRSLWCPTVQHRPTG
jgi:hypothetical protein